MQTQRLMLSCTPSFFGQSLPQYGHSCTTLVLATFFWGSMANFGRIPGGNRNAGGHGLDAAFPLIIFVAERVVIVLVFFPSVAEIVLLPCSGLLRMRPGFNALVRSDRNLKKDLECVRRRTFVKPPPPACWAMRCAHVALLAKAPFATAKLRRTALAPKPRITYTAQ